MIDYSEMSDFEVNKKVADIEGYHTLDIGHCHKDVFINIENEDKDYYEFDVHKFDPCNNPSDAWPIILENGIGLTPIFSCNNRTYSLEKTGAWRAEKSEFSLEIDAKNPLRAAMIVFLMMKDKDNDHKK